MTASASSERADRDAPAQSPPYGYLDGVVGGEATGWCWRPSDPSERLDVEVFVDGVPVGRGTAQGRRENVARAGYGDGRYGFRIGLPVELADGGAHRISARAGGTALTPAAQFIRGAPRRAPAGGEPAAEPDPWPGTVFAPEGEPDAPAAPGDPAGSDPATEADAPTVGAPASDGATADPATPDGATAASRRRGLRWRRAGGDPGTERSVELAGYIDGVRGDELFGWVVDPARTDVALRVEAFFDRESLGVADADHARPDVARAGHGERHGFRFSLPGKLGPGIHLVEVRTEADELRVPLASDYIVVSEDGSPVDAVSLRPAGGAQAPPPLEPPQAALVGLDGWLFEWLGETKFDMLRGTQPLPPDTFEHQEHELLDRHELARTAGAVLVEAIVPAKFAVYREALPAGIELVEAGRPADLLAAALEERNGAEVLDLAGALRHARRHGEVFPRTARGLTWLGGFAAYRAIANQLLRSGRRLTPLLRSELTFAELEQVGEHLADLPRMVWIGSHAMPAGTGAEDEEHEGHPRLDWAGRSTEYVVLPTELAAIAGPSAAMLRHREARGLSDALVIHDGSADRIAPFLAEHFERTLMIGAGAEIEALLAELEPAVVVEVVAESTLLRAPDST